MINFSALNWLDFSIIAIILFSIVTSLIRGFVREAVSLILWVVAFWAAFTFSKQASIYLTPYIHDQQLRFGSAFIIIFTIIFIVSIFINMLVSRAIAKTGLSSTDRLLGAIFGGARGVLSVSVLILILGNLTPLQHNLAWKQSQLIPKFKPIELWLSRFIPEHLIHHNNKTVMKPEVHTLLQKNPSHKVSGTKPENIL